MKKLKVVISKLSRNTKNFQPFSSREERAKFTSILYKKYLVNSVLDVGCSDKALKKWLSDDITYMGVDIAGDPDLKVNLEKENLQMFNDNTFQTVVCTEVLEHIENIHEIFDELCRVSNKYIIISLPNNWVNFKFSLISGKNEQKFYGLPVEKPLDRHKWFFNYDQALNFIKFGARKNNFNIKHKFSLPIIQNNFKFQIFNLFFKLYYKNQFRTNNLFVSSLWVLLEKKI
ncbi:MAG: methyltransferase domain-containing protein [Candidatus Lokiarchaeota archaeon]|nr:methyltransferase domain-containing protein [Candidatus Lokiarchaeota archaeon]